MCDVNISESLRSILDNECDVSDDDNAWLYSNECDKYDDEIGVNVMSKREGWDGKLPNGDA